MQHDIAITGLGVVTANATTLDEFSHALKNGVSGAREVTSFDVSPFKCKVACEIPNYESTVAPNTPWDKASLFAVDAADMALRDAGLDLAEEDPSRIGTIVGTTMGGVLTFEIFQKELLSDRKNIPLHLAQEHTFNVMADRVAEHFGLEGPKSSISIACASGTQSIGYAADKIKLGQADVMLAGGSDTLSMFVFSGFSSLRALTRNNLNKPFDKNRDGLILGEGAGIVVLERLDRALARNARIYGIYKGYGFSNDASHPTKPDREGGGVQRALKFAFEDSDVSPDEIQYINAHGTGTKANDVMECNAVKAFFGQRAYKIPMSTIKPMVGHTLGAAGTVEAIASLLCLNQNFIPPTLNYENQDPDCDLDLVPNESREMQLDTIMSLSSGFSGNNAAIIFKKYRDQL